MKLKHTIIIIASVILAITIVGVIILSVKGNQSKTNKDEEKNSQANESSKAKQEEMDTVKIEEKFENKIVYTTNLEEVNKDELIEDCKERGGTFQECGSPCSESARACIQACAYTCLLESKEKDNKEENEKQDFSNYENQELGFQIRYPNEMKVGEETPNRIEFMLTGPDQKEGTEITDGIRILVSRLNYDRKQTLKEFSEELADNSVEIGGEITKKVSLENEYEYATYTFTASGLGEYTHYIAPIKMGEVFDISVFISHDKYQEKVKAMLDSFKIKDPTKTNTKIDDKIRVRRPKLGQTVDGAIAMEGEAIGTWFFEGQLGVVLTDWDGKIIAEGFVRSEGEWMTEDFVQFSGKLEYEGETRSYSNANIIFQKNNPSGKPELSEALEYWIYLED